MLSLEAMASELAAIRAGTDRPFNVNFFCHAPPVPSAEREAAWRRALAPYFEEFGIDPDTIAAGPERAPFSAEAADVLQQFRPAVVSFHFGLPTAELLARAKSWGARILSSATTVEEALWLQDQGADAIIAQGAEAGGHRGMFLSEDLGTQVGTFALVPQVVRAVRVPVIVAGGIADARGVRAAMALGAAGVQVGTSFLLCEESTTSKVHRAALASEAARHTAITNPVHRPSGARHCEPPDARTGPHERCRAGVSPRHRRHRTAASQGGKPGVGRLLAAMVRPERERLQGNLGCTTHSGAGGRPQSIARLASNPSFSPIFRR